jgi:hypothetical protein
MTGLIDRAVHPVSPCVNDRIPRAGFAVAVRPIIFMKPVDTDTLPVNGVDYHGLVTERHTVTNR